MSDEPKILVVDDDPSFREMYAAILHEQGFIVSTATDRQSTLSQLAEGRWLAVLLDQKLQGAAGSDSGLDMLEEIQRSCPEARVLVITGYASPEGVARALAAGAYDYIEKGPALEVILPAKLRHITALYRAQEQRRLSREALHGLLAVARGERDTHRKGKLFEDFVDALFRAMPELGPVVDLRRRNEIEEIDVIVRNDAGISPWNREGAYFLVECKNWSSRVDRPEYDAFHGKLRRRRGCTLGFFLAPGGFTEAFREALRREPSREFHILPLDLAAIERLIDADDRLAELSRLHYTQTMEPGAK